MARSGLGRAMGLQPGGGDHGLHLEQGSWLLRVHSKVWLFLGVGPAFTFPTSRLCEGKTGPAFFSSFPTSFPSSKMTSLISAALGAQSTFSTSSGLSHINLSAQSRDRSRGLPQAGRLASQPCIPITFSTGFSKILSLLTGFPPWLFLPQTQG